MLVSILESGSVVGDNDVSTDELKSPPVSITRDSGVEDGELWIDELTVLLVSITDRYSAVEDSELWTNELSSLLVSMLESRSMLGDDGLRTDDLTSLLVSKAGSSFVL